MNQVTFGFLPAVGPAASYLVGHQVSHNRPQNGPEPIGLFPWVAQQLPNASSGSSASGASRPSLPGGVTAPALPPEVPSVVWLA
ncbi:MAG: hypothetical protein VKJ04_07505 [Vampirovibrionales bacterium]|nr:hypothetical protein [Vampirovibrionales bacterium]